MYSSKLPCYFESGFTYEYFSTIARRGKFDAWFEEKILPVNLQTFACLCIVACLDSVFLECLPNNTTFVSLVIFQVSSVLFWVFYTTVEKVCFVKWYSFFLRFWFYYSDFWFLLSTTDIKDVSISGVMVFLRSFPRQIYFDSTIFQRYYVANWQSHGRAKEKPIAQCCTNSSKITKFTIVAVRNKSQKYVALHMHCTITNTMKCQKRFQGSTLNICIQIRLR